MVVRILNMDFRINYCIGYVAIKETGDLKVIIIATGSELHLAVAAAQQIGNGVRVVSMPCTSRFDRQPAEYRESVLPASATKRVAVEAGVTEFWYKYVGFEGKVIGIDRYVHILTRSLPAHLSLIGSESAPQEHKFSRLWALLLSMLLRLLRVCCKVL